MTIEAAVSVDRAELEFVCDPAAAPASQIMDLNKDAEKLREGSAQRNGLTARTSSE